MTEHTDRPASPDRLKNLAALNSAAFEDWQRQILEETLLDETPVRFSMPRTYCTCSIGAMYSARTVSPDCPHHGTQVAPR